MNRRNAFYGPDRRPRRLGAVLEGKVQIIREDEDGARTILAGAGPGELFAEAFACAGGATLPVSVLAMTPCEVLLIEPGRIATGCAATCACHSRLIANMLTVLADKNLFLNRRLGHLSKRSTRDKLLSYLEEQAAGRADEFAIPFTRPSWPIICAWNAAPCPRCSPA